MGNRRVIGNKISSETFKSYYCLREELIAFLRQEGMQTGWKIELTNLIAYYLDTGEKLSTKSSPKTTKDIRTITADGFIENDFVCSEKHHAFFKQTIGTSFFFMFNFKIGK